MTPSLSAHHLIKCMYRCIVQYRGMYVFIIHMYVQCFVYNLVYVLLLLFYFSFLRVKIPTITNHSPFLRSIYWTRHDTCTQTLINKHTLKSHSHNCWLQFDFFSLIQSSIFIVDVAVIFFLCCFFLFQIFEFIDPNSFSYI